MNKMQGTALLHKGFDQTNSLTEFTSGFNEVCNKKADIGFDLVNR